MATPVVWLPLNGDLKNQGTQYINALNNNGNVTFTDGKLGKCLQFNGSSQYLNVNGIDWSSLDSAFSISIWFKLSAMPSSYSELLSIGPDASWTHLRATVICNSTTLFFGVADGTSSTTTNCGTVISANSWYHCCCTYNNRIMNLYINGVLKKTYTASFDAKPSTTSGLGIGAAYNGSEKTNGLISDIRIYNTCLSQKEVKEISQGLVLHYPLNGLFGGNKNLLTKYVSPGFGTPGATAGSGRMIYNGDYSIKIPATENADTYFTLYMNQQLVQNKTYTLSCKVDGLLTGSYYKFPLFQQGNSSMGVLNLDHNGICSLTFTMTFTGTQEAVTQDSRTIYKCFMDDSGRALASGQGTITLSNFKLEEGNQVTTFSLDPYEISYDETIIKDCSGFNNHGTLINNPAFAAAGKTGRYNTCIYFEDYTKQLRAPFSLVAPTEITIAVWIKSSNKSPRGSFHQPININSTNYEFSIQNNGKFRNGFVINGSRIVDTTNSIDVLDGQWHHLCATYNGSIIRRYVDGVPVTGGDHAATGTIANASMLYISTLGDGTSYGSTQMYESDLRIYTTALSETDVKALYNTPYSIDNLGQGHGYEYQESSNLISIQKNGIIKEDELNEIIILSDGSMWLPIMVHDNKAGTNLFSSSDDFTKLVYHNDDCWAKFPLINSAPRPDNSKYEFLVYQRPTDNANFQSVRWSQTSNPTSATSVADFTAITTGVTNTAAGGLCRCNGNTYMARTGTTSNWWHACGCWNKYSTGIPGWNTTTVNRELLLFMRVSSNNYRDIKNSFVIGTNFLEI